ncbi:hypothetical protein [Nocardioides sp.]|jgi:hypothetical protein|uniref:hypothetical protein n=1 Tax=Nocardioides sp. TaxID=35761 RepID=UPI00260749C5|nr:hypothetical protein [Nocardioides sp.]
MSVQTTHAVEVTTAAVARGQHESTCSCSCGWTLTTSATSAQMATRVAHRARANHFEDAHPEQPAYAEGIAHAPAHGHAPALSGATKDGFLWTRTIVCACEWERVVTERTPLQAGSVARAEHRRHVNEETDRPPARDWLILLGLIAVVGTLLIVLASVAINAASL